MRELDPTRAAITIALGFVIYILIARRKMSPRLRRQFDVAQAVFLPSVSLYLIGEGYDIRWMYLVFSIPTGIGMVLLLLAIYRGLRLYFEGKT